MKIKNKAVEKLSYKLRAKQGAVMIPAQEFGTKTASIFKKQYSLGLVADQNPGVPGSAYWLYFFSKPVPFIMGPERGALKNKTAVVFANLVKKKRGYYHFELKTITQSFSPGIAYKLYFPAGSFLPSTSMSLLVVNKVASLAPALQTLS